MMKRLKAEGGRLKVRPDSIPAGLPLDGKAAWLSLNMECSYLKNEYSWFDPQVETRHALSLRADGRNGYYSL